MNTKKNALGKGLVALIRDAGGSGGREGTLPAANSPASLLVPPPTAVPGTEEVKSLTTMREPTRLAIGLLTAGKFQPRRHFDVVALKELADSIKTSGLLQPILVRPPEKGKVENYYEIIAGERRFRAAQMAGLASVPVVVRPTTDSEALQIGLIENLQREELSPIEEARGFQSLAEQFNYSHREIAEMLGKSRPYIANAIRLLSLPDKIQTALVEGRLSAGQARALLAADNVEALADDVLAQSLTVREIENLTKKKITTQGQGHAAAPATAAETAAATATAAALTPDDRALLARLSQKLGLPILLQRKEKGGLLTIKFESERQIEAVINKLLKD